MLHRLDLTGVSDKLTDSFIRAIDFKLTLHTQAVDIELFMFLLEHLLEKLERTVFK
jgi:hypothetical protein